MKLVVDAQLPPALADWLREQGMDASAVRDLGLRDADDDAIWRWALQAGAAIVTKDKDFVMRRTASAEGPAILWLRIGNTLNRPLIALFARAWPEVRALLEDGQQIVELR